MTVLLPGVRVGRQPNLTAEVGVVAVHMKSAASSTYQTGATLKHLMEKKVPNMAVAPTDRTPLNTWRES